MNPTLSTYLLHILQGQETAVQVLIFVLNSLRDVEFLLRSVGDPTIWEQGKKDSLSRGKQYDLVSFLMFICFLNYMVFPQNGRYYSSLQATLQFWILNISIVCSW